jgi:Na+/proline symporter
VLVAFLAAGWIAGRSATLDDSMSSALTGFVAGAVLLVTLIWLTTAGVTNLVGFLASNFTGIVDFTADPAAGATDGAFDTVRDGAWATFIILVAAMILSAVGGLLGHQESDETVSSR